MSANEYSHGNKSKKETIEFDNDGVCYACRFNEMKDDGTIDLQERETVVGACDKHRKNDGSYDCIVGGSGGKDSAFQSYILKYTPK